jgi:hypothetical protein
MEDFFNSTEQGADSLVCCYLNAFYVYVKFDDQTLTPVLGLGEQLLCLKASS